MPQRDPESSDPPAAPSEISWEPQDSWAVPSAPLPEQTRAVAPKRPDEPAPKPAQKPEAAQKPAIALMAPSKTADQGGPAIAFAPAKSEATPSESVPLLDRIEEQTGVEMDLFLSTPPRSPGTLRPPVPLPPRYTWISTLGEGGQGSVELVMDLDLGRPVALKTLHRRRAEGRHLLELYREARITGQLDHPNIIPVFDAGQLPDGRLYYTMPRMPGQSLHRVLARLRRGDPESLRKWGRAQLLQVIETVSNAVGYAHARGVVHRDIKPANVLLGRHGEVYVVDWGIARVVGGPGADSTGPRRLWSEQGDTRTERVRGSPPYMAPEQVKHPDQVGPGADVFCLGVLLYEALCRVPPFQGDSVDDVVEALCHRRPVPPRERAPQLSIPPELEEICLRALEKFPGHRQGTAAELAAALAEFRGGGKRRAAAARRVREAESMRARHRVLKARSAEAHEKTAALRGPVGDPVDPEALREAEDQERSFLRAADGVLSEAVWALHSALEADPDHAGAQAALGQLYADRYAEAERRGDDRELAFFRALLRRFDDGRWGRWMRTGATLDVQGRSEHDLVVRRLVEQSGVLVPGEALPPRDGATWDLAPGRYAVEPGEGGTWHYPIAVGRDERRRVRLDLTGSEGLSELFCFVPGGPTRLGGDRFAPGAREARDVELPPFAIARHPVTVAEWARFLDWIADDDPEAATRHRPAGFESMEPREPVTGIGHADATAYCDWMSGATGLSIRLPLADEWEKACRGADGRLYPWGDRFSVSLCACSASCDPGARPPEIGAFPADRSPFGMEGGAGGVWEWTDEVDGERAIAVGGAFITDPEGCRSATRRSLATNARLGWLGFRIVQALAE